MSIQTAAAPVVVIVVPAPIGNFVMFLLAFSHLTAQRLVFCIVCSSMPRQGFSSSPPPFSRGMISDRMYHI